MRTYIEKSQEATLGVVKDSRDERETILEGRSQAFTVQSEQKIVAKLNQLHGKIEALTNQANSNKN